MRKIKYLVLTILVLSVFFKGEAQADWWTRDDGRPVVPTIPRESIPTIQPLPTTVNPTQKPAPTVTGTPSNNSPTVTPGSNSGGGNNNDDPCAAGKSYVGPYCGWSPNVNNNSSNSSNNDGLRIGGTEQVLGLSYTAGNNLTISDIMLLAGVLCLLLYARSKISQKRLL